MRLCPVSAAARELWGRRLTWHSSFPLSLRLGVLKHSNTGFGVDLKATAVLTVEYGFGAVVNGQAYTVDQVTDAPDVSLHTSCRRRPSSIRPANPSHARCRCL